MRELVYIEIPTPDTADVRSWLQTEWVPEVGEKIITSEGLRLRMPQNLSPVTSTSDFSADKMPSELSAFVWSVQRTTYLKVFRWGDRALPHEKQILQYLTAELRVRFPHHYPEPPEIGDKSIFEALAPNYPLTVKYFQKFPQGEYDLTRAYWWEKRWREGVRNPQQPQQVIFKKVPIHQKPLIPTYDLIYIGGALGVIHAAVMAQLGYKVLLIERLPFGRMNREWNISRAELQSLINLGLLTPAECESIIAREYKDGFNKFFDGNNPDHLKAPVLHTPTVLNVALDAEKLLQMCGEKLQAAGGEIWDETEFLNAVIADTHLTVKVKHLPTREREATGRLLVDAMGTASPIAWQLNGGRAFDSVCPTVGAVISDGFDPEVWDSQYGDVLNSHGDISRGRQLIWELFPGTGEDIAIYLFHYHQVNTANPGSLLEMYEDFFTILPEYRRCDLDKLVWKKATFGYIPGHFSSSSRDRTVAFDRLIAIGDAASLQSPLVFTGFGSLVRNLERLSTLLDTALKHDLLKFQHLNQIRAYQSNVAVTWLFSKGMMVPTGRFLPPQRINSMLNTFFGLLTDEPLEVADTFIKDRVDWLTFNRLALKAARKNPAQVLWIWDLAGPKDIWRWLGNYINFGFFALFSALLSSWFPGFLHQIQSWLEPRYPALWLKLLAYNYELTAGMGHSQTYQQQHTSRDIALSQRSEVRS
ncbi:flavin-dependent dehydrogenase [Gloeocapsopsis crepidinum LEGE 06123]|uniref:Flavin-dependent dehydrogenase n=1 Tax=Gloeocapsopsis crepidinum LEGE 06123 TaxID=588587 RepID=A0ABR9UZ61_9CHRO|nr:flavin-dependent dehydrogenase [Gloeocapsopsis crepidinum]MBE9192820.1 flavin-dependent dehydrogenase [Gloeocapsopsis crepidinum LEGE 06123]